MALKKMSSQEEEMSYQLQMSSQGLDYDASDLVTKEIVPTEVEATEVEHSAQVTTITVDSITNPAIIIDREYFYTSLQKNNNKRKAEIGPEWQVLKNKVSSIIESQLNLTFILNAQKMKLKILANNTRVDVISMHDLGTCYAQDDSLDNFVNMNYVLFVFFVDNPNYLKFMETKIMKQLNIEYDDDNEKIGCIARLAGRRKNDKVFKIIILSFLFFTVIYCLTIHSVLR